MHLLSRLPPDRAALWQEAEPLINQRCGLLVVDAVTLDKSYTQEMNLLTHHWSDKHQAVVEDINLTTLL